jgi:glycosyltransferase involved in cell wall biosynthesis
MKVILSHAGKQHSYYVAKALLDIGVLEKFYTSSYLNSRLFQAIANKLSVNYLKRRFLGGLYGNRVSSAWHYEILEIALRLGRADSSKVNNAVFLRDEKFDSDLAKKLKKATFDTYWGFQGSSLQCLKAANGLDKNSVCEMTIAHLPFAKKLLTEEAKIQPDWADTIDFFNFPAWYEKRLIEEPQHANKVIAISKFLKHSLIESGISEERITVVPLGFEPESIRYKEQTQSIRNRPLRVLFAGRVTQRKGISYLLEAMKGIEKTEIELHVIGNIHGNNETFFRHRNLFQYTPGVSQHTLFQKYCEYDALIFPSLLEGFGLVTVEAMGAGLPVITTANTNAYELIQDEVNGYLIPIRSSEAIVAALLKLRQLSDDQFRNMRLAARQTALQYTWLNHQKKVESFIHKISI